MPSDLAAYRSNPEWQAAQAEYIEPAGTGSAAERQARRMLAARRMCDIERRYEERGQVSDA
jgi:hypothetical protein